MGVICNGKLNQSSYGADSYKQELPQPILEVVKSPTRSDITGGKTTFGYSRHQKVHPISSPYNKMETGKLYNPDQDKSDVMTLVLNTEEDVLKRK